MCAVLNPLIAAGDSTAHSRAFDPGRMRHHYIAPSAGISCMLAEVAGGVVGFQSLVWADSPDDPLPPSWMVIASFVAPGQGGRGIGGRCSAQLAQPPARQGPV